LSEALSAIDCTDVLEQETGFRPGKQYRIKKTLEQKRRLDRRYEQLTDHLIPVIRLIKSGVKHPDAFRRIAENLGVTKQTVQLDHISTDEFVELISSDKIKSFLKERFPDKASLIEKEI
jgi:hypothetical protein